MPEKESSRGVVFISRAGEDSEVARHVAETLREAGFATFLQDEDFGHTSFMERMAEGFRHVEREGCLVALLTDAYQRKPHCLKEARFPLIADPSNIMEKLVVLRVDNTTPQDFLKDIPYVDLSQTCHTDPHFDEAVVSAVERSFSRCEMGVDGKDSPAPTREDPKIEKLMTFLENEDAEDHGNAILAITLLFSAIGVALILFEQALLVWNWLFSTSYYPLFDWSDVLMLWCLLIVGVLFALFWQIRTSARTIEDAHLKISQLKELRILALSRTWKSEWFVRAVIQTATRNITSRR